jgi:hypothetical protein
MPGCPVQNGGPPYLNRLHASVTPAWGSIGYKNNWRGLFLLYSRFPERPKAINFGLIQQAAAEFVWNVTSIEFRPEHLPAGIASECMGNSHRLNQVLAWYDCRSQERVSGGQSGSLKSNQK